MSCRDGLTAPFAAIEADIAEQTTAMLANVIVNRTQGKPFAAELDVADEDGWEGATVAATHTLRHGVLSTPLAKGESLLIAGEIYHVCRIPRRQGAGDQYLTEVAKQ